MPSLDQVKTATEAFQAVCIGIASILGGLGALKVLSEWRDGRKFKRQKKRWRRLYPPNELSKNFRLLRHSYSLDAKGEEIRRIGTSANIYVCDDRSGTRHWVANIETLHALGFNGDEVESAGKEELEKYQKAEQIDFNWD